MTPLANDEVMRQVAAGNEQALEEILFRCAWLAGFIRKRLPSYCQGLGCVEDILQVIRWRTYKYARSFDPVRGTLENWLCAMVINEVHRHKNGPCKHSLNTCSLTDGNRCDGAIESIIESLYSASPQHISEVWRLLEELLQRLEQLLTEQEFYLFKLRFVSEADYQEICSTFGLSATTARQHVFQLRKLVTQLITTDAVLARISDDLRSLK